ncbi:efflux RND transporter periplasmic adaptor subunit [uncultured Thiohalocapsa sp.]|uniref:efflux RND transporter periplasmic adaptor subunit n=1 Tax=uncultured Thiohalocapsa sp. TaxID=768990 RepID=UPI0025D9AE39|nr:efflux RND transporter periplasmic adaptor subunit [uncultured Thiohalocapsa sp.]
MPANPAANRQSHQGSARLLVVALLLALAALLVAGWVYRAELAALIAGGGADQGGGRPPPLVETAPVRERRVEQRISATGTLIAPEAVTVTARTRGRVARVLFEEGDRVAAGAPLLRLARERAAARVDEAKAQLDEQRRDLARLRELRAQDFVSATELEQAEAAAESAAAALAVAEEDLDDRVLKAPFAGIIGRRLVSPGALLEPGTPVADLRRNDPLDLLLDVPETALGRVTLGQRVTGTTPAYPDRAFRGEVTFVGTRVSRDTRTLPLEATFPNPDGALKPGMFLQAALVTGTQILLTVPEAAVIARGPTQHLYVLDAAAGGDHAAEDAQAEAPGARPETAGEPAAHGADRQPTKVRRRSVQTGLRRSGWVAITDGVSAGEQVVTAGLQGLRDGAAVRTGGRAGR